MARAALKDIQIFNPYVNQNGSFNAYSYYDHGVESQENFRNAFPVTDQCERSAQLMGDDYVRLKFNLTAYVPMAAFSFIRYDGQTFFLMNDYCPHSKGSVLNTDTNEVMSDAYEYDVKFYSVANMLRKPICYRHVKVQKENSQSEYYEWDEPEISVSATLETMYVLIVGSIAQYVSRLQAAGAATANYLYPRMLQTLVDNGLGSPMSWQPAAGVKLTAGTELSTFSFNGDNIADVCTAVANQFSDEKKETEWYIVEDANHSLTLHFCKCEDDSDVTIATDFSQKNRNSDKHLRPIITGGLSKVEYSRDTSNIPQVIVPYGAERNMTYAAVKGIDEISHMQSTFGKRVRLKPETDYDVWRYAADGVTKIYTQITTDIHGGILNDQVTTGVEKVEFFEDVYPQCHFQITKVDERIKRQDGSNVPEYTCEGDVVSESGVPFIESDFFPIQIEEGTTLSVRFESGFLNGREFEIANKSSKKNAQTGEMDTHYTLRFTIVADGSIEDGTLIPSGNFKPMVGDKFALFNMKMPEAYITYAQGELAQKAYEKLLEYQETVPDVKCTTNPRDFAGKAVAFGKKYKINSEKIGFTTREVEIDGETRMVRVPVDFLSRITAYSYKLTKPDDIQFTLSSALVRGVLSEMASAITSVTNAAGGLGQRSINLSRRGWRDASEIADMLDSVRSEMMLVGNEKYQFGYTMSIEPHDASHRTNEEQGSGAFNHLHIGYGTIQHTQQPYVDYPNAGLWEVSGGQDIDEDANGNALVAETPYFVYADCQNHAVGATATIGLYADKQAGDDYMLLGILSSEYEHQRVFSPTNGFTAIAGGQITTEQIQDANRRLIIDFLSNPPRIIAVNGAEIYGNFRFKSMLTEDGKNAGEEIFKEIGGENLYTGVPDFVIPFDGMNRIFQKVDTGVVVSTGVDYVVSIKSAIAPGYSSYIDVIVVKSGQPNKQVAKLGGGGLYNYPLYGTFKLDPTADAAYEGGKIYITAPYGGSSSASVTGLMIQKGQKPTTYQPSYKYLAEAFEHDARMNTTDIDGGLVSTSLIKLRKRKGGTDDTDDNPKYVVTAGMSGIDDVGKKANAAGTALETDANAQGVTMWGGGDYVDALKAAAGLATLPILLTKTGIGSMIGCFKVASATEIQVKSEVTENGTTIERLIRIDTGTGGIRIVYGGVEKVVIAPGNMSDFFEQKAITNSSLHCDYPATDYNSQKETVVKHGGNSAWSFISEKDNGSITVSFVNHNISRLSSSTHTGTSVVSVPNKSITLLLVLKSSDPEESDKTTFLTSVTTGSDGTVLFPSSMKGTISGLKRFRTYTPYLRYYIEEGFFIGYSMQSMSNDPALNVSLQTDYTNPITVIAKDGVLVTHSDMKTFCVKTTSSGQQILMTGLPTSQPSTVGQLWNDGGVIKIKQ